MKKALAMLAALALAFSMFIPSPVGRVTLPVYAGSYIVPGDADGDGEITDWDSILFERYLSNWNVEIILGNLDLDGDGEVTDWDSVILNRFMAGWDVSLPPTVPEPTPEFTEEPTAWPTAEPTAEPTPELTREPTSEPVGEPTPEFTEEPTAWPTAEPTAEPTPELTREPTSEPVGEPTPEFTEEPTAWPTAEPTAEPTPELTREPTEEPTPSPTPSTVHFIAYENNYGSEPVRINKAAESPSYYYKSKITSLSYLRFYEDLEAMVLDFGTTVSPSSSITVDEAYDVLILFLLDHPEVFWFGSSFTYTNKLFSNKLSKIEIERAYSVEEARAMKAGIDAVAQEIIDSIPDDATDIEAELIIFNSLRERCTYVINEQKCYTVYGALVEGECVCEGYSEAFQYISGKIGLFATSLTGIAGSGDDSGGHKWNAVMIGGKWYEVDVTWADNDSNQFVMYFNNSAYIDTSRTPDEEIADLIPAFTATDAEYLHYYGLFADPGAENTPAFDLEYVLTRSLVHFKGSLTGTGRNHADYAFIYVEDSSLVSSYVSTLSRKPKAVREALAASSLGDGYTYAINDVAAVDDHVIAIVFYRY